eukprot:2707437-Prymnesium_polylepis.1
MWPEFDYEARLMEWQPPLPMLQRAVWANPVGWKQRNRSAYSRVSLNIYNQRRRVRSCARHSTAFNNGRVQVREIVHSGHLLRTKCSRTEADDNPMHYTSSCKTSWTAPPDNWLDHYRQHQFSLFLPGQQDWSTTFQLLMSLGGALVIPNDLNTETLWTSIIKASCPGCTLSYNRSAALCQSIVDAISVADDVAELTARSLEMFVRDELNERCIYAYMQKILNGLRHAYVPTVGELQALNFKLFDCTMQHELVSTMYEKTPEAQRPASPIGVPTRHHDAYFDATSCKRREVPKPLPFFLNCSTRDGQLRVPRGQSSMPRLSTALAWC